MVGVVDYMFVKIHVEILTLRMVVLGGGVWGGN